MGINYCGKTDIGLKRATNQDCFRAELLDENMLLMLVCDGMGGAAGGSEASSLAADTFVKYVKLHIESSKKNEYLKMLEEALKEANAAVHEKSKSEDELEGMGTTLVCALYDSESYYCLWVGDSRIYAVTKNGIDQISHDHSFVQSLIDNGSITKDEAKNHPNRNIITKAVGTDSTVQPDVAKMNADNFLGILLCSDGLCGYVAEDVINSVCAESIEVAECCEKLVNLANEAGGLDNITVVIHKKQ